MKPHFSALASPSSLRRRSFSFSSVGTRAAANASVSRFNSSRWLDRYAPRHRSDPSCNCSSGATSVRRNALATGSRSRMGSTIASRERMMQTAKSTTSVRELIRPDRATPPSGAQDRPVLLLVVEDAARAPDDARQRILVHVDRETGLLAEQEIQSANERSAARHDDAAIHDVARQLGRRDFQRAAHRVHDLLDRFLNGLANLARMHAHRLRDAAHEVASLYFHLALVADRRRAADLDLDLLRRRLADQQVVVLAHELHDRHVELIATRTDGRVAHDAR